MKNVFMFVVLLVWAFTISGCGLDDQSFRPREYTGSEEGWVVCLDNPTDQNLLVQIDGRPHTLDAHAHIKISYFLQKTGLYPSTSPKPAIELVNVAGMYTITLHEYSERRSLYGTVVRVRS